MATSPKYRICTDPSDFNKVINREHYPMHTVEEVVSAMPDAKVFSVMDTKSEFLQIKLNEASSFLTTVYSPIGGFRWLMHPFGLNVNLKYFKYIMDEMLEGLNGAAVIMNDILIAASAVTEHDEIMHKVIQSVH